MLKKNDVVVLEITDITNEGSGIGRVDGMAIFVPYAAVGERLQVRIVKVLTHYAFGIIEEVLMPSDCRCTEDCAAFRRCGSCSLRHITYDEELRIKNSWVQENMRRIGKLEITLPPAASTHQPDRYRNKAIYPVRMQNQKPVVGFFAKRSHRIEPISDCLLHPEFFGHICAAFCSWLDENGVSVYDEVLHTGLVRALYIRHAEATGEVMVTVIANGRKLPQTEALIDCIRKACAQVVSINININTEKTNVLLGPECRTLWGSDTITDKLCGLNFTLSPLAFYQVNRRGAELLYGIARDFANLKGGETLLDLYCGAGTIGLSMAHQAGSLIGVEVVAEAVENAILNAAQNGITNARFICADAAAAARQLEDEGISPDVIILDPPRKGCAPDLIDTVVRMAPDSVVMVSCDSATAARDVARFNALGYYVQKIQAVDMFPRTAHVETVVLLSKGEIDSKKVRVEFSLEDMDMSDFQDKATYTQIKDYVLEHSGLKVSNLYISQIKRKCGLEVGKNYNLPKAEDSRQPQCPPEKENAIREAMKYFGMI